MLGRDTDSTGGALWYNTDHVSPYRDDDDQQTVQIGPHIFYR